MKEKIYENSVKQVRKDLFDKMEIVSDDCDDYIGEIATELIEGENPLFPLSATNLDSFIEINDTTSKENYHFPDVVNMGELINYSYAPSKILEDSYYETIVPFLLPVKESGIAFFMNEKYKNRIMDTLETTIIKLLGSLPNGLARVSLIDKTGAGQNFKSLSTLHEKFIEGKVLSTDNEIELELEALKNSMSIISASIAGNGFDSIEEYNLNTDEIPQHYQFVVVSNFPTGFNKKASENLLALIESGHRAGIYVFFTIALKSSHGLNQNINGLPLQEYIKNSTVFDITERPSEYVQKGWATENTELFCAPFVKEKEFKKLVNNTFSIKLDDNKQEFRAEVISRLNEKIENINLRPVVDLEKAIPEEFWTKTSNKGVCVPFGKRGIENVFFSIGINQYNEDENTHHALIAGSTGSGKTSLINDFILQTSMLYSPEDVSFYLLDYKEGTEFAMYKNFPYVEILSMESEIEFGQEVLERVISEITKRGNLFKKQGANNLDTYNKLVSPEDKLKRVIIIIDEFQVLFPKNPKITMKTNELINDILRRGRSFGFNLFLSTQTLKGVDLEPALLSNIPLRVGLKMDDKDAIKIFGDGNTAPHFLKYPGEGIYNNSFGKSKSNVSFQAFRAIDDAVPNVISLVNNHMERTLPEDRIKKIKDARLIYNGEKEPTFEDDLLLAKYSDKNKIFIGTPTGLDREDVSISFERNFADNAFMIGQEQDKALSMFFTIAYQALVKQDDTMVYLVNYNTVLEEKINQKLSDNIEEDILKKRLICSNNKDTEQKLEEVFSIFEERKKLIDEGSKEHFPTILFCQFFIESGKIFLGDTFKNKNLEKLIKLIAEGPEYGVHSIYYASDFSTLSSQGLSRELTKFKVKMAFKGGDSLKIFGLENGVKFSKSNFISVVNNGVIGEDEKKFKPYNCFLEEKKED